MEDFSINEMLCYGITAEELKQVYRERFEKNMDRW